MNLESSELYSSQIHLLPEHLIDQIKAGEVIERPASLIKEIIENSIDAGSTQIDLHLVNCGIDLISISDNGKGMSYQDLPFAFCRHATSKIERFEDLYKLSSFGFRGEALASISAIARVTCTSSPKDNPENGGKIVIHGGETKAHAQQPGTQAGTSLYIKDLFYNTPVRLKFIKSQISEKNALKRIIQSFIISNPDISFSIKWDDADKEFYPSTQGSYSERIAQVFYSSKNKYKLHIVSAEYEGHKITAFLSESSTKGNSYKKQFLFANHRLFTDKQIHQNIIRHCDGIYPQGEMGHYCVFIDVPPNLLDVNVHPNKTQIKFFKLPVITALISSELKKLKNEETKKHELGEQPFNLNTSSPQKGEDLLNQSNKPLGSHFSNQNHFTSHSHNFIPNSQNKTPEGTTLKKCPTSALQILIDQDQQYLIHKYQVMNEFLKHFGPRNGEIKDDLNEFIPLLISSPLWIRKSECENKSEEEMLSDLLKLGIQVERLDDQSLVLRSYHKVFIDFPLEPFIIGFFKNNLGLSFLHNSDFEFTPQWISPYLNKLNGIRKITPELLEKIFNE